MKPSPLQLEQHFFSKISLEAHTDGHIEADHLLNCTISIGQAEGDARRFQVEVRLQLDSPPDKKTTYTGEIWAVGLFRVLEGWPEEKTALLVEANGVALLFGAIRELLLNLTSRGPWPQVRLNAFSFIPETKSSTDITPSNPISQPQ